MPSSIGAAASFVTKVIVGTPAIKPIIGNTTLASIVGSTAKFAAMGGLSIASQELLGPESPNRGGLGEGLGQRLSMRKRPAQPHRVIYGKTKVGGDLNFFEVNNDGKNLHMIVTFTGHPVEEIQDIWLDDDKLDLDNNGNAQGKFSKANVKINKHDGTQSSADQDAVDNIKLWTSDHVGTNKSYVYLQAKANNREDHRDLFPSGMPEVKATIKGKNDIFDPRDSNNKYTVNPALCARDFLVDSKYGYGFDSTEIDEDDVKNSANTCEEQVNGEDRYTCNGSFRDDARKDTILRNILTSMAGKTTWSGGKQRILAGAWRAPINTYNIDHIIGEVSQTTKRSRNDLYNTVRGTFADPEKEWQPTSFPEVQEDRFVAEDDNLTIPKKIELPFTTDEKEAQRIASIMLRQHRKQKQLSTTLDISAFNTQAGDNISFDIPHYDWNNKDFSIDNWALSVAQGDGDEGDIAPVINLEMTETAKSIFEDVATNTTSIRSPALTF